MNSKILYSNAILIDTSAAIALHCQSDAAHIHASDYFHNSKEEFAWVALNITAHESYTRARYDKSYLAAVMVYDFLKGDKIIQVDFDYQDEVQTMALMKKYCEHKISYHDALCAIIMKKLGIYRIFSFDRHFWVMGFQIQPGWTK